MPGANVTVRNVENGQTRNIVTEADGSYRVPALPVGNYEVRAEKEGLPNRSPERTDAHCFPGSGGQFHNGSGSYRADGLCYGRIAPCQHNDSSFRWTRQRAKNGGFALEWPKLH